MRPMSRVCALAFVPLFALVGCDQNTSVVTSGTIDGFTVVTEHHVTRYGTVSRTTVIAADGKKVVGPITIPKTTSQTSIEGLL